MLWGYSRRNWVSDASKWDCQIMGTLKRSRARSLSDKFQANRKTKQTSFFIKINIYCRFVSCESMNMKIINERRRWDHLKNKLINSPVAMMYRQWELLNYFIAGFSYLTTPRLSWCPNRHHSFIYYCWCWAVFWRMKKVSFAWLIFMTKYGQLFLILWVSESNCNKKKLLQEIKRLGILLETYWKLINFIYINIVNYYNVFQFLH